MGGRHSVIRDWVLKRMEENTVKGRENTEFPNPDPVSPSVPNPMNFSD